MKKLPIGIQTFRTIREEGYVYADKTKYIYDLIEGGQSYFLSRPRRFGKSLLLDTIAEVFKGSRELFDGLWIADIDYDWVAHPVVRIDFGSISKGTPEELKQGLSNWMRDVARQQDVDIAYEAPDSMFKNLLSSLHEHSGQKVAVLIDEYDKAIIDHITEPDIAEANRRVLSEFYTVLKGSDADLCFIFLTGVSKFAHASIFSGLNNLNDITFDKRYAGICGFTYDDFDELFDVQTGKLDDEFGSMEPLRVKYPALHAQTTREAIFEWYDGYSWDGKTRVFNPFSLLRFFDREEFIPFWFETGTPNFLMQFIRKSPTEYVTFSSRTFDPNTMQIDDVDNIPFDTLLLQTGYLTICKTKGPSFASDVTLCVPNFEVQHALDMHVLSTLASRDTTWARNMYVELSQAFVHGEIETLEPVLTAIFASIPSQLHVSVEAYYDTIFYVIMRLVGFKVQAEVSIAGGRIDGVLETDNDIYIMEMKYKSCDKDTAPEDKDELLSTAIDEAFTQIEERGYAKPYMASDKRIRKVAIAVTGRDDVSVREA